MENILYYSKRLPKGPWYWCRHSWLITKGWKQIKMMFQCEDRKALQTLVDNITITSETHQITKLVLHAIQTIIKEDEYFWYYHDELVSDVNLKLDEPIQSLSKHILQLTNNCNFRNSNTKDTLKIIIQEHAVKYHEARDWVQQQDKSMLAYNKIFAHCKTLEICCEQYQKAKDKGHVELTTIITATESSSFILQYAINTQHKCKKCGCNHIQGSNPAYFKDCYSCSGKGHTTNICRRPHWQHPKGEYCSWNNRGW